MNRTIPLIAAMGLLGCSIDDSDPNDGGQFGEETGGGCEEVSSADLALDEVSALGFSAQDLLDLAEGEHIAPLTWADDSEAELTVVVADASGARFVDYEPKEYEGGIEPAMEEYCQDYVILDITLGIATDDGVLAESFSSTLRATDDGVPTVFVELEGLAGSFDPTDYTSESFDTVWADLDASFDEGGVSGEISGYGETTHGTGDDAAVSMSLFEIASFGEPGEGEE